MKNLQRAIWVCMLVIVTMFTSCNNDDEPRVPTIVGVWSYEAFQFNLTINGQQLEQFFQALGASPQEAQEVADEVRDSFFSSADFEGTILDFRADGTYEIRVNSRIDETGTYELLNGNTLLRLTSEGESTDFEVRTLTNNQLTIVLDEQESGDFLDIGLPVLLRLQLELRFVK